MTAMAKLRPVDAFFEKVTVSVAEGRTRRTCAPIRLRLLNEIREATRAVADFSKIEGWTLRSFPASGDAVPETDIPFDRSMR